MRKVALIVLIVILAAIFCCPLFSSCADNVPSTGGEQNPGTEENENEFYRCTLIDGLTGKATVCETEKDGLLEEPEHEEKKHYNFAGWYTDEGAAEFPIKVTQDISLVAVYEKIVYRISYELGGGINAPENPTKYDIETPSVELLPAERKCFEFGGWYDENGNVRTSVDIDSDGDVTLHAEWINEEHAYGSDHVCGVCGKKAEPEHIYENDVCVVCGRERMYYVCDFIDSTDGSLIHTYSCAEGNAVSFPDAPNHEHYKFKGWYVGGEPCREDFVPDGRTEFSAVYEAVKYKVVYILDDGTNNSYNPSEYTVLMPLVLKDPFRKCHGFGGWYLDEEMTVAADTSGATVYGDITLYAKWLDPSHIYGEDHVCAVCGEYYGSDMHKYNENHICDICSAYYGSDKHEYGEDHLCTVCGKPSEITEHAYDEFHECMICGKFYGTAEHRYGEEHACVICGAEHFPHVYGSDHVCAVCGFEYESKEHVYGEDGKCTVCGESDPLFGVWTGGTASAFAAGNGTETDPYIIRTGEELAYLAMLVNEGDDCRGKYFALAADINLGGAEWVPIGYGYDVNGAGMYDRVFGGFFDGRGYTISGMKISSAESRSDSSSRGVYFCAGLFGAVCGDADFTAGVTNLRLSEVSVKITVSEAKSMIFAGGIAGFMNKASFSRCFVEGDICVNTSDTAYAGGLYGAVSDTNLYNSTIDCGFEGRIFVNAAQAYTGGIAGYGKYLNIKNCFASAEIECVSASANTAGLFCDSGLKSKAESGVFVGIIRTSAGATADLCVAGAQPSRIVGCVVSANLYTDGAFSGNESAVALSVSETEAVSNVLGWINWTETDKGPRPYMPQGTENSD